MMTKKQATFLHWGDPTTEEKVVRLLNEHNVIITDTDTIPGFLARTSRQGFDAINNLKKKRSGKPYIILIGQTEKVKHFVSPCSINAPLIRVMETCWPGPLTIIFKAKDSLASYLKNTDGTVALRCPNHAGLQGVLRHFSGLYSTSANKTDKPAPHTCFDLDPDLVTSVPCIVSNEYSCVNDHLPSTILDCSRLVDGGAIRVVREGAYSLSDIERYYGLPIEK